MKEERNNEIDLLLRRLGRRKDLAAPGAAPHVDAEHLDADELSSYAENVLPAAARAHYTEHLADCAGCRKLVAQLSASVGAVGVQEVSSAAEPSAFRRFLTSLFSPMVLRYAVPALGLIVVAVIGFVALRQNDSAERSSVAYVSEQKDASVRESATAAPGNVGVAEGFHDSLDKSESRAVTPEARGNKSKETRAGDIVAAEPDATASGVKSDERPAKEAEAQPAPKTPAAPAVAIADEQRKTEAQSRKQPAEGAAAAPATGTPSSYASPKTVDRRAEDVAASSPAPERTRARESKGARSGLEGLQVGRAEQKDRDEAETRSVAGRRFRKSGARWIDTAYQSSQATVDLTRGSEQYRALVADEPGIKTIAEQLDGEIIVVWKGRAYRIR